MSMWVKAWPNPRVAHRRHLPPGRVIGIEVGSLLLRCSIATGRARGCVAKGGSSLWVKLPRPRSGRNSQSDNCTPVLTWPPTC